MVELNAALVLATGASTAGTIPNRISGAGTLVDANIDFGVGGSATATENTSRLQAALAAVDAAGGGVVRVHGDVAINGTIYNEYSNVFVQGDGADHNHDTGTLGAQASARLIWNGSAGGTMFIHRSITGAGNQKLSGGGMLGVYFRSGSAVAAKGLVIQSRNNAVYDDLFFEEFSTTGLEMNVVAELAEARDSQGNRLSRIGGRIFIETGAIMTLDGSGGANTSMNTFYDCYNLYHKNGVGILLGTCDNNTFIGTRIFRAPAGTANAITALGNATVNRVARANQFIGLTTVGPIFGDSSLTYDPYSNQIIRLDKDNASPNPTGVGWDWNTSQGLLRGAMDFAAWTPTIASSAGAITAYSISSSRYRIVGQELQFHLFVHVSDNGTGSDTITATMPTASAYWALASGYETGSGRILTGTMSQGSATMTIRTNSGAYPIAGASFITMSGRYEI